MSHKMIYANSFPELAKHYDSSDEGHTRGHYEHFEELYEQSIEDAETEAEKEAIKDEIKKFTIFVNKSDTEYFTLLV